MADFIPLPLQDYPERKARLETQAQEVARIPDHDYPQQILDKEMEYIALQDRIEELATQINQAEGTALLRVTEEKVVDRHALVETWKPRYTNDKARAKAAEQQLLDNPEYCERKSALRALEREALELKAITKFLERRNQYALADYEFHQQLRLLELGNKRQI